MSSFFGTVKSWLSQDFGGRYFSLVLKEVITNNPKIMWILFPDLDKKKKYKIESEYFFYGVTKRRRADLAILEIESGVVVGLVEVKYDDERSEGVSAQLNDYIAICKNENIPFVYLLKNIMPKTEQNLLNKTKISKRVLYYSDLYQAIKSKHKPDHLTKMMLDFIGEETMIFENKISNNNLVALIMNACWVKHQHGLGKTFGKRLSESAPETLQALIVNMRLLSNRFHEEYGATNYTKRPTVNFRFKPMYNSSQGAIEELKSEGCISADYVNGGKLQCYSWYNIKNWSAGKEGKWYGGIEFGFYSVLDSQNKRQPLKTWLYAGIKLGDEYVEDTKLINMEKLNESKIFAELTGLILGSLNDIQKKGSFKNSPINVQKQLRNLRDLLRD